MTPPSPLVPEVSPSSLMVAVAVEVGIHAPLWLSFLTALPSFLLLPLTSEEDGADMVELCLGGVCGILLVLAARASDWDNLLWESDSMF
jgi:hypothetical protein